MNVGSLFKVVSSLHLPNYDMHYQVGNCTAHTHCGLITYVHNSFKSNKININYDATGLEHLTIEICKCKKIFGVEYLQTSRKILKVWCHALYLSDK